ncbi:AI-2E family transporter [Candidatus Peregrinibacteria bacterium]|nr:AI-2E family transporter [Candidatus Peregrinibacteria bacterium]
MSISSAKVRKEGSLIIDNLPGYFLIAALVFVIAFMVDIMSPFLTVVFVAAVLTIAFYPIHKIFLGWFRGWGRTASAFSTLLVILVIIVPIAFFVVLLASEAFSTYQLVQQKINSGVFDKYLLWKDGGVFYDLKQRIDPVVDLESIDLKKNIIEVVQGLSTFLVSQIADFIKSLSTIVLSLVVMIFCIYYFFKDGVAIVKRVGILSPFPSIYESQLFAKIKIMVKSVVFGVFMTAVVQGIAGGIGFAIAGISNPVFWGTAMAFFSLFPVVGTAIVWVPAVVVLAILGDYWQAVFLLIYGVFVIGSIDNFVRPFLIGGKSTNTHPLMMFLVVLGGVVTMGLKGVIIGPIVLIMMMSFLHIYEFEYKKVLKK